MSDMAQQIFTEAIAQGPVKSDKGRWLVAVATPGQGSSGYYSEDMLQEFGPTAFPAKAKCFVNHNADRNPKDLIGVFPEGAYWDEDRKQLMAELEVFSHWKDFLSETAEHLAMSIYMAGEADEEGNVTKLVHDPQNGADLVSYPGLAGSGFVEMLESARAAGSEPLAALAEEKPTGKDASRMDEAQFNELKTLLMTAIADREAKAQEAAQVEADEALAQERVDALEAAFDAIDAADLTSAQKKALRKEAKAGRDVKPLIESQVELKAEILKESGVEEGAAGRVVSSGASTFVSPWGGR